MAVLGRLRKELAFGQKVPCGYSMAWYEPKRRVGVYFPTPLHWVVRACREFGHRLWVALHAPHIERAEALEMQRLDRERRRLADEFARGYLSGWRECFQSCLATLEEELSQSGDPQEEQVWISVYGLSGPKN